MIWHVDANEGQISRASLGIKNSLSKNSGDEDEIVD